ncbi:MAG: rRNA maturation RNase YbeY, partial [Christensenellales bacterium]
MKQVQIDNLQRIVPFDTQMRGNMTQAVQSVFYTVKGVTAPLEVQISLIGPRAMRRLNRESRNIDRETDVLSFPYLNWEGATPGDFTTLAEPPMVNMETGRILMGDIVISMHRAAEQAEEY